jgi:hypothetical protein
MLASTAYHAGTVTPVGDEAHNLRILALPGGRKRQRVHTAEFSFSDIS